MTTLLKVCGEIKKNVFGTVLHWMVLLCRADNYPSNKDCAALRAMTGSEGESAVMLFLFFSNFLKFCGAIHNFYPPSSVDLRRKEHSLFLQLSDCAAG